MFESSAEFHRRFEVWEPWFCWHPINLDGTVIWLERVERKLDSSYALGIFWSYRLPAQKPNEE
jgi:hypothetical protein